MQLEEFNIHDDAMQRLRATRHAQRPRQIRDKKSPAAPRQQTPTLNRKMRDVCTGLLEHCHLASVLASVLASMGAVRERSVLASVTARGRHCDTDELSSCRKAHSKRSET